MQFPLNSFDLGSTYFRVSPPLRAEHELALAALHARVYRPSASEMDQLIAQRRKKSLGARMCAYRAIVNAGIGAS